FIFYPLSILGFNRNDGHVEVSFNYNQNRIEEYFVLNNFGAQKAKHLNFLKFQKILLSTSLKLNEVNFIQKMGRLGARKIVDYKKEQNHIIGFML
ncbi:MAG: hypothetical protein NTY61_01710, partial [Candidatus Parcubacteria bacterium]|nr:hypothetical protein [Candidatus Parcubacteria bacterium]